MIDLNLVRVFVTIFETGSVSRTAERLHVTQPSISYALARLRKMLNDPLFKRSRDGMQPTFLATQLYAKFRFSLSEIERAIAQTSHFDPRVSTRGFRLALSDLGEVFFLPYILQALQKQAPHTELEILQIDIDKLGDWLKTGKIDAAICNRSDLPLDANCDVIFQERYVCLIASDHPRIGDTMTIEQYLEEHHVVVSAVTGHHVVEDRLREAGLVRKVRLRVPHFSVLPEVVSSSDLVVTLPARVARMFASRSATRIVELPFPVPAIEIGLQWNDHDSDILAQRWFCTMLKDTLKDL
ncbi:LysR family transcriptional regulator [Pseudomonas syringae]|uniref:LysR family transcriptional regulator n=1 Tax=Pseudomonas syringae TaxID=317 RepID=UPI000F039DC4|nr:LysR family transcriptional regulator [Pseudomonas syringae]MCF5723175.1 LysR family transcriptional regulator [Pseudomonas syringae]